jgi:hypothetical protein
VINKKNIHIQKVAVEKSDILYRQYESLRNEIFLASSENFKLTTWMVGIIGAVMYFCIEKSFAFGLFSVFCITYIGYEMCVGNRRRIWRIATYIRVYMEPQLKDDEIQWETRLHEFCEKKSKTTFFNSNIIRHEFWWFNILNFLTVIVCGYIKLNENYELYSYWNAFKHNEFVAVLILAFSFLIYTYYKQLKTNRHGEVYEQMFATWKKMQKDGK